MLEEKINKLIDSVDALTFVINRLWDEKNTIKGVPQPPISAEPPKVEKPKAKKADKKSSDITHDELHKMALSISRKDPKVYGPKIKAIIKGFDAELIKDVPVDKLPELKIQFEQLEAA